MRDVTITGPAWRVETDRGGHCQLGLPVVVTDRSEELSAGAMRHPAFVHRVRDGVAIVELAGGRTQAALQRRLVGDHVPVTVLNEHANAVASAVAASLTEQDREAERIHVCAARTPHHLIPGAAKLRGRITNPAVTAVLDRPHLPAGGTALTEVLAGAREQQPSRFLPPPTGTLVVAEQFPLLASIPHHTLVDARTRDHVVAYLNALAGGGSQHRQEGKP